MGTPQPQRRRGTGKAAATVLLAALVCAGALVCAEVGRTWVAPSSARRSALAGAAAGLLGGAAAHAEERDALAEVPGQVSRPGANPRTAMRKFQDSEEVVAKRIQARKDEEVRQEKLVVEFRELFSGFANDDADLEGRIAYLGKMQQFVLREKALPLSIQRDDVVKGIRTVKFNLGCTGFKAKQPEGCKPLEKAIVKLIAVIEKVYDKGLVQPR